MTFWSNIITFYLQASIAIEPKPVKKQELICVRADL